MGPQLDSCGRNDDDQAPGPRSRASMGPQLDSCGRVEVRFVELSLETASMGPQLDSCGRRPAGEALPLAKALLQWGRNLTVAEGKALRAADPKVICFNGAAT